MQASSASRPSCSDYGANHPERSATALTTNRVYKHWPAIFNNDSAPTSALLDRLLHHADTVRIEGKSCRMKEQIQQ
ncbi:ATP-binding protein [Dokdonella soli]|uniref:ATP-binding protein n=1 Tax=Dokdonella soli TaxID=529810 RepID=UPI003CD05C3B